MQIIKINSGGVLLISTDENENALKLIEIRGRNPNRYFETRRRKNTKCSYPFKLTNVPR